MVNPIHSADFAKRMTPALQRAGKIAEALRGRVRNCPKLAEPTAVKQALTEADLRVQEEILAELLQEFPECCLAAEEDTPRVELFPLEASSLVIIDPIDGTLHSYLEGGGPYAVIVGLAKERQICAALVSVPEEGVLIRGARGDGVQRVDDAGGAQAVTALADGPRILVSHTVGDRLLRALEAEGFEVVPASGGAVSVAPLIPGVRAGLRLVSQTSEAGVSIRGRVGVLLAREAGAQVRGDAGQPFPGDLDTPNWSLRVTADEADQDRIERALEVAGSA